MNNFIVQLLLFFYVWYITMVLMFRSEAVYMLKHGFNELKMCDKKYFYKSLFIPFYMFTDWLISLFKD